MKKAIFSLLCAITLTTIAMAQVKVETIDLKGKNHTVTKDIPADLKEILGLYKCDTKDGYPIVELRADGTGRFQFHGVEPDNIEFWLDCDEKGEIRKQTGEGGNYGVTLLYKYTSGSMAGQYDLLGVMVSKNAFGLPIHNRPEITGPYAVILGERYKSL